MCWRQSVDLLSVSNRYHCHGQPLSFLGIKIVITKKFCDDSDHILVLKSVGQMLRCLFSIGDVKLTGSLSIFDGAHGP